MSAAVAHEVNIGSKALGGNLSFLWGTVKALAKYKDRRVRLRVDGGEPEELDVTVVAASNGRYFGSGMCVAPKAVTHDGLFDLTIWQGYGLSDFVLKSKGVYNGDHITWNKTRYSSAAPWRPRATRRCSWRWTARCPASCRAASPSSPAPSASRFEGWARSGSPPRTHRGRHGARRLFLWLPRC